MQQNKTCKPAMPSMLFFFSSSVTPPILRWHFDRRGKASQGQGDRRTQTRWKRERREWKQKQSKYG